MSEFMKLEDVRKLQKGIKVERAASLTPQGAPGVLSLFNVLIGRVAVIQLVGECTVICGAIADSMTIEGNPTVGTTVPLCTLLSTANDEVGTLYGIEGDPAVALIGINAGALPAQERSVILPVGTLDWRTLANNTGEIKWTLFYVPIDDGAHVTVA